MPNPPYGPDQDRRVVFEDSGAARLLELGRLLAELEQVRRRGTHCGGGEAADLLEEVLRKQEEVLDFFRSRPKAAMRKHVALKTGKGTDARACRVVGYLGARMVMRGEDCVPIMQAAAGVSVTDSPGEVLESRRAIAALGSHGTVEIAKLDGLWHPRVRLAGDVMLSLLGGGRCIPVVSQESLTEIAADRRRRLGQSVNKPKRRATTRTGLSGFVESIPFGTPAEICCGLGESGYVGQEPARRAVALAAYRHVMRLRMIHLKGVPRDELPPAGNLLCIGPTGTGKSFMMRLLFEDCLLIPTAVLDVTSYSETGYVGNDVSSIPTHLLLAADGDADKAQTGVIVLDEFDKLAEDGSGTATRVSRHGVQRSLLKLLDPGSVETPVSLDGHHWRQRKIPFRTHDLLWIACGAFSGLETSGASAGRIGFADGPCGHTDGRDASLAASDFESYGLLPELVGRFGGGWVGFDPLSRSQLDEILRRNAIEQHRRELRSHAIGLKVEDGAIGLIVEKAMDRGTGARGIEAELSASLEQACYEAYSSPGKVREVRIRVENGELAWDLAMKRPQKADEPMAADELRDMAENLAGDAG